MLELSRIPPSNSFRIKTSILLQNLPQISPFRLSWEKIAKWFGVGKYAFLEPSGVLSCPAPSTCPGNYCYWRVWILSEFLGVCKKIRRYSRSRVPTRDPVIQTVPHVAFLALISLFWRSISFFTYLHSSPRPQTSPFYESNVFYQYSLDGRSYCFSSLAIATMAHELP